MSQRVLVVEDSQVIQRLIEVCLRPAGFEVETRDDPSTIFSGPEWGDLAAEVDLFESVAGIFGYSSGSGSPGTRSWRISIGSKNARNRKYSSLLIGSYLWS